VSKGLLTYKGNKMDLMAQPIVLKDLEYRSLVKLIYDKSGINLGDRKQELVKTRLGKRLRALGIKSYGDYFKFVTTVGNDEELKNLINAISTNFTSFYREPQHFEFLFKTALKVIAESKEVAPSRKIRAWCAAASSGEEPYSLGITLLEYFKAQSAWDIKLLATDISSKVLTEAFRGTYPAEKIKTVSPFLLDRYFEKETGDKGAMYRVKNEVKRLIIFRHLNLMDPVFPFRGPFDFIFCRNVLIYFDLPTQEAIVAKILKYLAPGGYFFTSHSENIPLKFRSQVQVLAPATYRKVK